MAAKSKNLTSTSRPSDLEIANAFITLFRIGMALDVSADRDVVDVTTLEEPDPNWRYKDRRGHIHKWEARELPTLRVIWDTIPDADADDADGNWHYECKKCVSVIVPQYRSTTGRNYVSGLGRLEINGISVSKKVVELVGECIRGS